MSGLFGSLIARNLGGSSSLRARALSLFEPAPAPAALSTSPATRIQSTVRSEEPMTEESDWILDRAQNFPAEEADIRPARQQAPAREVTPHKQTGIIRQITEMPGDHNSSPLSIEEVHTASAARPTVRTAGIQSAPVVPLHARHDPEIQAGPSHPPHSSISALAGRAAEETPTSFRQRTLQPSTEGNQPFGQTLTGLLDVANSTRRSLNDRVETASRTAGRETRIDHHVAPLLPAKRRAIQPDFTLPARSPEPSIHVTIGRIEIRAEREGTSPRKNERTPSSVMGLEEYLRRKNTRGKE
jgi:hypothetical protein